VGAGGGIVTAWVLSAGLERSPLQTMRQAADEVVLLV
jgi:hypothetical protein